MTTMHCRICSTDHDVPDNATHIGRGKRGQYSLVQFGGSTHDVRLLYKNRFVGGPHERWHVNRNIKKPDCLLCFPEKLPPSLEDELSEMILEIVEDTQETV